MFQRLSQDLLKMVLVVMMVMQTTFQGLSQDVFRMVFVNSTSDTECAHNWS